MTRRAWLRHPAQTINQPRTCPNGPRYRTRDLANDAAVTSALRSRTTATVEPCDTCSGWHIVDHTPALNGGGQP